MSLTAIRSRDWTRPYGIQRPIVPPDDELTELAAWLAGRFDSLAATRFELEGER